MARFATEQHSETEAINTLADLINQSGSAAFMTQSTGAVTLTAAQMINGVFFQTGTPGAFSLTTPTAALLVAAIKNCQIGSRFDFTINNAGDNTITVVAGDSVTLVGTTTVATNKARRYMGIVTAVTVPAVSLYGVTLGDK